MRIVFIGQAPFGKDSLAALIQQGEHIVGVITVPDPPGQKRPNPVKELAEEKGLPLLQPARLKHPDAVAWVRELKPDLLVLAFVTDFAPLEMIRAATHGGINYHPSLLPKYRGGSAINWAVISGERETGVTIHQIDEGVDTGPIVLQEKVAISPEDTVKSLYFEKLYPLGIKLIPRAVALIREGKARPLPQDESEASFQPVIKESDTVINWKLTTQRIYDLIRGSNPSPGAVTSVKGRPLKIWEARPYPLQGRAGDIIEIIENTGFVVSTADGGILVERVQFDNAKITAADFIKNQRLRSGDRLGG
ncbi:MAG: methionyl-tRNA formyltransferase [Thermodesulfobacteriota bacterium]